MHLVANENVAAAIQPATIDECSKSWKAVPIGQATSPW